MPLLPRSKNPGAIHRLRMQSVLNLVLCVSIFILNVSAQTSEPLTAERRLDFSILKELTEKASVVVIGEIIGQPLKDTWGPQSYGDYKIRPFSALSERSPFFVEVKTLISGELSTYKTITVSVQRDEVGFRYPTNQALIFFLKKGKSSGTNYVDKIQGPGEWRTVSDYFGILPHTLTLERALKSLARQAEKEKKTNRTSKSQPQPLPHATNIVSTETTAVAIAEEEVKRVRDWKDVQSTLLTFDGTQWTIMTFRLPFEYGGHAIVSVSTNGQILSVLRGK